MECGRGGFLFLYWHALFPFRIEPDFDGNSPAFQPGICAQITGEWRRMNGKITRARREESIMGRRLRACPNSEQSRFSLALFRSFWRVSV
jgi:hypothetical protein